MIFLFHFYVLLFGLKTSIFDGWSVSFTTVLQKMLRDWQWTVSSRWAHKSFHFGKKKAVESDRKVTYRLRLFNWTYLFEFGISISIVMAHDLNIHVHYPNVDVRPCPCPSSNFCPCPCRSLLPSLLKFFTGKQIRKNWHWIEFLVWIVDSKKSVVIKTVNVT